MITIIITASAAALFLLVWFALKNEVYENPVALIYKNGELYKKIELNLVTEPYEIILTGENGETNTIIVKKGEISITEASCPDHICIKTGAVKNGAVPIICLPNRVEIRITEKENDVDAMLR